MQRESYSQAAAEAAHQFMNESGMDKGVEVEEQLDAAVANKQVLNFATNKDIEGAANYLAKYEKGQVTQFLSELSVDMPAETRNFLLAVNSRVNEKKGSIQ